MEVSRNTVRRLAAVALTIALGTLGTRAQQPASPETTLGAALNQEQVVGNFKAAVDLYKKVIADPKAGRSLVARALLQLAGCYERLGQADAVPTYERVVKEHADSGEIVTAARARLAVLQSTSNGPTERFISNDRTLGGLGMQRWSPDGRYVIGLQLTASEFDGHDLKLLDVQSATARTLAKRPGGFGPGFLAFSPDSRRFAALMPQTEPQSAMAEWIRGGNDLATMGGPGSLIVGSIAAGSTPVVVDVPTMSAAGAVSPAAIAWSPDGQWIAYGLPASPVPEHDIELMQTTTGVRRPLGIHVKGSPGLTWSPSGDRILMTVAAVSGQPVEMRVITVASGESRPLPVPGPPMARVQVSRWTTAGDIAIRVVDPANYGAAETFLVSAVTGQSRKTCSGGNFNTGGHPNSSTDECREITADGTRQIVWQRASKHLVVRDLKTGADRPLTAASGDEYFGELSPDGRVEIFASNRDGRWSLYATELSAQPDARPRRLSVFDEVPSAFYIVCWTPSGFIASDVRNESNILRVNVDSATSKSTGTERLTQDAALNHTAAVSPDAKRVAYWSQRGSQFGVAVMDHDGANERLILETRQDVPGLQPSWRSVSELLFTVPPVDSYTQPFSASTTAPAVARRIMSLNTATGVATAIGELSGMPLILGQPRLLPATGEIVYEGPGYKTIVSQSIVDGRTRVLATFDGDLEIASFLVSPDAKQIAYVLARRYPNGRACFSPSGTPAASVNDILTTCEMGVLTIATGERTQLIGLRSPNGDVAGLVAWSPDGRYLLYGLGRPQLMDTTTRTAAPLVAPGTPLNWGGDGSWSPDGTFIVLTNKSERFQMREWKGVRPGR